MKIVVLAGDADFETIKRSNPDADWVSVNDVNDFGLIEGADAFFDLTENTAITEYPVVNSPLFLNSVIYPVAAQKKAIRINGWNGFLENETWEVAGDVTEKEKAVLEYLNKKIIVCADEPGFISARIIAMIINEAYYAKGEEVSTEAEIDIAMKLGTNYPYGPFEWAQKIGLHHIYTLLKKLSMQDERYQPSPLLTKISGN
jgi:3-hydroxybutyryl-CoA dehydrogenase